MDDRLFEDAFRGELEMSHPEHPDFSVLWDYVALQLEPEFAERISLHLATCGPCGSEVREIREEQRALSEGISRLLPDSVKHFAPDRPLFTRAWERFLQWSEWLASPKVFYRHATAAVTVGVLLLALNIWMNQQPQLYSLGGAELWALRVVLPWWTVVLIHGVRFFLYRGRKH